jgi:hypothetical protein
VQVLVDYLWRDVGPVKVEGGKLRFPSVAEIPGVYRFDLGNHFYIGETDRLRRRFQHYRTPGPSQATNVRLNAKMLGVLDAGTTVTASVITDARVVIDGNDSSLDLSQKAARLLIESAALTASRMAGLSIENL